MHYFHIYERILNIHYVLITMNIMNLKCKNIFIAEHDVLLN